MVEKGLSRRRVLAGAGALAAGAVLARLNGGIADAAAKDKIPVENWPWPYVKLDPAETAEIAYHAWYRLYCGGSVISSIFGQLRKKVGGPYNSFPIDSFIYLEGGTSGWGTICGSLGGMDIVTNLIVGPEKIGPSVWENHHDAILMGSDIMQWYTDAQLPVYVPKKPMITAQIPTTISHSPLCHVSVGRWMKAADKPLNSPERKHRCARVAASVAYHLVELLNQWKDGKYSTEHVVWHPDEYGITAQNDCEDCHGSNVPTPPEPSKKPGPAA